MIEVKFDNKMIKTLSQMIGKQFVSYKCGADTKQFLRSYGNILFILKDFSVELTNYQCAFPFFDRIEDVACFSCRLMNESEIFIPCCDEKVIEISINEKIKGIQIVNDTIFVKEENYEISIDNALILMCEENTYIFSRDIWFSETIDIDKNKDINDIYPIKKVIEDWNNDGEYTVTVKRTTITI